MERMREGQSLMEIIVALAIGAILIGFSTGILVVILNSNLQSGRVNVASNLGNQLIANANIVAQSDWHTLGNLLRGSPNPYYVVVSSSTPFSFATGTEAITLDGIAYTRYFYLSDISRDTNGNVVTSGGTVDPSTEQITSVISWQNGGTISVDSYLTRSLNKAFVQSNWSGGAGVEGPITQQTNRFATSTNLNTSNAGSINVRGF